MKKFMMTETIKYMIAKLLINVVVVLVAISSAPHALANTQTWEFQSVDTMKTSRDQTLYKRYDKSYDERIKKEIEQIKSTGANYVTVDGAYDEEYRPWLKRWVKIAREADMKIWYRGNFSAWHGWFGPKDMTREEHIIATEKFILNNPDLFEDGDSFTSCPECESGGPGNPLETKDISGFREFMIEEYNVVNKSFETINKDVYTNWLSINPDVAKAVYDEETLQATGNLITLDYFIKDTKQLEDGLDFFIEKFPDAKLFIGEFGAPIPEINGRLTDDEKAAFIDEVFHIFAKRQEVIGVNYWISSAGATELLDKDLEKNKAADIVQSYFKPIIISGKVTNTIGESLRNVTITDMETKKTIKTDKHGNYKVVANDSKVLLSVTNKGYKSTEKGVSRENNRIHNFILEPIEPDFFYKTRLFLKGFF